MLAAEDNSQMGEKKRRETNDDVHAIGCCVLKVHIGV
jgi:hypothetical protein